MILLNNIFANSRGGGHCGAVHGRVTSHSNLIEDAVLTCGLTNGVNGNIIGSDPALGPLTGYIVFDFPPPYFPLKSGSRAIDAGYDLVCPATDQRGVTRPQGSHCDIGAYEYP